MRKTKEELQQIKEKYGVKELWSFSRVNKFLTSPYEYYLKYILKIKEDRMSGIYATSGGIVHDIIERFYTHQIEYEQMLKDYENALFLFDQAELKYNVTDAEKNAKIACKYEECIKHFFCNHKPFKQKALLEQFALTFLGGRVFQGYIDFIFQDNDGNVTILDWKTSTMYTGTKVHKESKQLLLYALSLIQHGVPIEKIKICWNFIKYVKVSFTLQNGNKKERYIERNSIGSSLASTLKTKMKALQYSEDQINHYLETAITTNSLDSLPQELQEQFVFEDGIVYIPFDMEILKSLQSEITSTLDTIDKKYEEWYSKKEQGCSETVLDHIWYDTDEQLKANEYYFYNLCGYSKNLHKPWGDYVSKIELLQKEKDNIFFNPETLSSTPSAEYAEDDLSWLNGI